MENCPFVCAAFDFAKVNKVSVTVASMYGLSIFDLSNKEKAISEIIEAQLLILQKHGMTNRPHF